MFPTSTQFRLWTFSGNTEIGKLRTAANQKFIAEHGQDVSLDAREQYFLTPKEEKLICRHYEYVLKNFAVHFQPPMPKYVLGTSMVYFKRFYLHNSVMDYHPKDIVFTCVYLACKVEEFNVSIQQFINNCQGNREKAADIVLSHELLLMHELQYHLTIHNPFRPLEGLLIDIKTRCTTIDDAEKLRKGADDFLDRAINTDIAMIFAPSQIALAAILSSAAKIGVNLDSYVTNSLLGTGNKDNLVKTIEHIKRIRYMVKHQDTLEREEVRKLEEKLERCRNQENNPDSDLYKEKMEEMWEEVEERRAAKRIKIAENERETDEQLLGL